MNKSKNKSVKAEITVIFKTCDLMDYKEFTQKYHGDIEQAVKDILANYPLIEIIDKECVILNIEEA